MEQNEKGSRTCEHVTEKLTLPLYFPIFPNIVSFNFTRFLPLKPCVGISGQDNHKEKYKEKQSKIIEGVPEGNQRSVSLHSIYICSYLSAGTVDKN